MGGVLLVGHSHINAIAQAAKSGSTKTGIDVTCEALHFLCRNLGVTEPQLLQEQSGGWSVSSKLSDVLKQHLKRSKFKALGSIIGGNAHNVVTLIETEDPFDMVLPSRPDLPLDPSRRLLTYKYVYDSLSLRSASNKRWLEALARYASNSKLPIFHLESPPTIGDDSHVASFLDPFFKENFPGRAAAPRWVRYKMWRVYSDIMRDACNALNIPFIPCPAASMDEEGFLRPEGFPNNATHANEWYGNLVLEQMHSLVGKKGF